MTPTKCPKSLQNPNTPAEIASSIAEAMFLVDVDEDLQQVLNLTQERATLNLPPRVIETALDRLSKSRVRDPDMRVVAADDRRSSAKTLSRLAGSAANSVCEAVATNPRTPVVVMEQLARNPAPSVRATVAGNLRSSATVFEQLAHDEDRHVRTALAANPNLPLSILKGFLLDAEASVRAAALKNPVMPADLICDAEGELALSMQRFRPDRAALEEMVANTRAEVRMEVAFSPAADADLLTLLVENDVASK